MQYTTNLNLKKPGTSDNVSIGDLNDNMDIIDAAIAGAGGADIQTSVSVASWSSDSTYPDYPYRASVPITGVTASDVAEVVFGVEQAVSGDYAPVCETYSGGVYLYAKRNDAITIPTMLIFKGRFQHDNTPLSGFKQFNSGDKNGNRIH